MIERVLENWLSNASERGYQVPFCQALSSRGQKVLHSTRHCAMEMGKDIIAQDKEGFIHLYQLKSLKGKKLTQRAYRETIAPQLMPLILGKPIHPSIPKDAKVKTANIVLSGDINEEAAREIDDLNRTLAEQKIDITVKTITFGELISLFSDNLNKFGPKDPIHAKLFLELFLSDGRDIFPKENLFKLLNESLYFESKPSDSQVSEVISTVILICALAASNFQQHKNWFSEFECWGVCLVNILGFLEKWNINDKNLDAELNIVLSCMFHSLDELASECVGRKDILEGDALADSALLMYKSSMLVGLLSLYLVWGECIDALVKEKGERVLAFIGKQYGTIGLWGESCGPYLLSNFLLLIRAGANNRAEKLILETINHILVSNSKNSGHTLPSPYYSVEACIASAFDFPGKRIDDKFIQSSFLLESFVNLMVLTCMKEAVADKWKQISHFTMRSYLPQNNCEFLKWRSKHGTNEIKVPKMTQSWKELEDEVNKKGNSHPIQFFNNHPYALLASILILPHRMNSDTTIFLYKSFAPNNV